MKKILIGIFGLFLCGVVTAEPQVVNSVDDKASISWTAMNEALPVLSSQEIQNDITTFLIEYENSKLSARDLLTECLKYDTKSKCVEFVKKYFGFQGGDANDCHVASSYVGTEVDMGNQHKKFDSLTDVIAACSRYEDGVKWYDGSTGKIDPDEALYASDSYVGNCKRFMDHLKKCNWYLEDYYTRKLQSSDTKRKDKKRYQCVLDLVARGELDLPVTKMENSCK